MKKQHAETLQVTASINELSATSERVNRNASQGAEAASIADSDTRAGAETVNFVVKTI
jgi:methyl-accepting chemotaxis protein